MLPNDPFLEVLGNDLEQLIYFLIPGLMVFMLLPAGPIALVTAFQRREFSWWCFLFGLVAAWLSGVIGSAVVISVMVLAVEAISTKREVRWGLSNDEYLILLAGAVTGIWFAYRLTQRLTRDAPIPSNSTDVPNPNATRSRRFHFSLRRLFLVQMILLAILGLWVAARRPALIERYRAHAVHAMFLQKTKAAEARFAASPWRAGIFRKEQTLCLIRRGAGRDEFSEADLDLIRPEDEIAHLEIVSNELTNQGLQRAGTYSSLHVLTIDSDQITDAGIRHLRNLDGVYRLAIRCPNVTAAALRDLQDLQSLRQLDIELPSSQGVEIWDFRRNRPNVVLSVVRRPKATASPR